MHNNQRNNNNRRRNNHTHSNGEQRNNSNNVAGTSKNLTPSVDNGFFNRNAKDQPRPIGFRTLEDLFKNEEDSTLLLKLSTEKCGFFLLLDQYTIRPDLMCLILKVLGKVSDCATDRNTTQLLAFFYMKIIPKSKIDGNFHKELKLFVFDLPTKLSALSPDRNQYILALQNLLKFLRKLQLTMPQNSYDLIDNLLPRLQPLEDVIIKKENRLNDVIVGILADLSNGIKNHKHTKMETDKVEVLLEAPDDFRKISIYPDSFDIQLNHEPFLRPNIVNGKYVGGVDHYLDVQFRLLREDFVRPLREGISEYVRIKNAGNNASYVIKNKVNDLNVYKDVQIISSKMLYNEAIQECIFNCTPFKKIRWQNSKRLLTGSLVCLSADGFETFFFATVAGRRNADKLAEGKFQLKIVVENSDTLNITPRILFVMIESQVYLEAYRHNLKVLQDFNTNNFPLQKYIIDVNNDVSPPSYLNEDSCFELITKDDPVSENSNVKVLNYDAWPPRDAFGLDESQFEAFRAALTKQFVIIQGPPGTGKTFIGLRIIEALLKNTKQIKVTERFRRMQSTNSLEAKKFHILVICYTNHALDQFLDGIMPFCNSIIRIGGRSQMEHLQEFNLSSIKSKMITNRNIPGHIHRNLVDSRRAMNFILKAISSCESKIENITNEIWGNELINVIEQCNDRHILQFTYMAQRYKLKDLKTTLQCWLGYEQVPLYDETGNTATLNDFEEFEDTMAIEAEDEVDEEEIIAIENNRNIDMYYEHEEHIELKAKVPTKLVPIVDADGFQMTKKDRKKLKQQLNKRIKLPNCMTLEDARNVNDVHQLQRNHRWRLYRLWIKTFAKAIETEIKRLRNLFKIECVRFEALTRQEDLEIIESKKVIGMTTTGAAKYRHIIEGAQPQIIIVEEAAEVLEAHIITAMNKSIDHLILIGDHQQLKPNPAVYELAKKFNLEVSLFERMIKNGMSCYQLKQQHRMRPSISSLLVPHIYKQLLNAPSVMTFEDIKGITANMFFINHEFDEVSEQDTKSHINTHEADFIVELCRYLVLQGYNTSQITILTMYSGQLFLIKNLIRSEKILGGVRATVVDNFQGEENDIILLSFVRSNDDGNVGFLKISNRVNVALSRAKKGLYCIGNYECLAAKSSLWKGLVKDLQSKEAIGNALSIYCQNHPDQKSLIVSGKDFREQSPEGGCLNLCGSRLACGHACPSICHIIDKDHLDEYAKCSKSCDKAMCQLEHRCKRKCHYGDAECGECTVIVEKYRIECSHNFRMICSADPSLANCYKPCDRNLDCGHKCKLVCGARCNQFICSTIIKIKGKCGHELEVKCSNQKEVSKNMKNCKQKCGVELKCGHPCEGTCGACQQDRLHVSCKQKCDRILVCGHACPENCATDCPPCHKKCENKCSHSTCPLKCGNPCAPCMEPCQWHCKHHSCSKLCSELCDRDLCEFQCLKKLKCGHQCIGVCGEPCPEKCRVCDKVLVETILLGYEDERDARFIQLQDCPHFIEATGLIEWIQKDSNSVGESSNKMSIQLKRCPQCNSTIKQTKALNKFVQSALKDIEKVKAITYGTRQNNKTIQLDLNNQVQKILDNAGVHNGYLKSIYNKIHLKTHIAKERDVLSKHELLKIENKLQLLDRLNNTFKCLNKTVSKNFNNTAKFKQRLESTATFLDTFENCEQQRNDIINEVSFLNDYYEPLLTDANQKPFNQIGKDLLQKAFEIADTLGPATDAVKQKIKAFVSEANQRVNGIGISFEEKTMILRVMGFQQGHWYKCPNGHVYAIGDCGGASVEGICPECGKTIGGQSHRLRNDNAIATEMDGATAPAWS